MKNVKKIKKNNLKLNHKIIGILVAFIAACVPLIIWRLDYYIDKASEASVESGKEFFSQAEYADAIEKFEAALNEHNNRERFNREDAEIYRLLGTAYKMSGNLDKAINCYTDALGHLKELEKSNMSKSEQDRLEYEMGYVCYLRGMAYLENNDYDKAYMDYEMCGDASELIDAYDNWEEWYTVASVCNLAGKICDGLAYKRVYGTYFDTDMVHNTAKMYYTWYDAFIMFNRALQCKGIECINYSEISSGDIMIAYYAESDSLDNERKESDMTRARENRLPFPCKIIAKDAEMASILINRAGVEYEMDMYEEVIEDCNAALTIYGSSVSNNNWYDIDQAYTLKTFAKIKKNAMEEDGDLNAPLLDECYQLQKDAVEYNKQWKGSSHAQTAYSYGVLGFITLLKTDYDEAIEYFTEAKNIYLSLEMDEEAASWEEWIASAEEYKAYDLEGDVEWITEMVQFP